MFQSRLTQLVLIIAVVISAATGVVHAGQETAVPRKPRIGVAFGGGSARGLAHVGVIRWFEEHHIPIDLIAGTSMGGLVGGSYASGMSSAELAELLKGTDWDEMFGSSPFLYKNVRRKQDARAYPSRIEFGLKNGIVPPLALNNGQQVDFMLARMAAPYSQMKTFDDLPTPFRCMAVDLVSAKSVVLDHGSLPDAMRATMSLPGIFPPVQIDGRVLVDGGAMNNVPADVVRQMGADVVIAVNVGYMGDTRTINYSLFGLMGQTVDVMMQANTRIAMKDADIVINPPLKGFASLDWRKNEALAIDGYQATEALKDQLLPLAIDDASWAAYLAERQARRKTDLGKPQFVSIVGAAPSDQGRIERVLERHVDQPIDISQLEKDLDTLAGLDRYETVGWQVVREGDREGLVIRARPKIGAPPFLMLGVTLENTTSDQFAFQFAGRYLAFDTVGSGSELRIDAAVGAEPEIAAELFRPLGKSPLFVAVSGRAQRQTFNFIQNNAVIASYNETRTGAAIQGGVDIGRDDEVRLGFIGNYLRASIGTGDPGLPEIGGGETRSLLLWIHDGQDSPVVPSSGTRAIGTLDHIFKSPEAPSTIETDRTNTGLNQADLQSSTFWSWRRRDRLFVITAAGTSFGGKPLPTEQFQLGRPLHLGAYDIGQFRGDHSLILTGGYLRGVGRLPDFMGGPIYIGGWLENGSVFNRINNAKWRTNASVGAILDTLIGPMILGASFSFDGNQRYYIGIGRIF